MPKQKPTSPITLSIGDSVLIPKDYCLTPREVTFSLECQDLQDVSAWANLPKGTSMTVNINGQPFREVKLKGVSNDTLTYNILIVGV